MTQKPSPSDVKQKIEALSSSSTPIEEKKLIVEFLANLAFENEDCVEIVKEYNGILVLTTLFKTVKDYNIRTKISSLLYFLSLSGHSGVGNDNFMNDVNILSLVNLLAEKDFRVFMQSFGGLRVLAEPPSSSSTSSDSSNSKSLVSFSLSAATLFLDNIANLIDYSSKQLSDMQKPELLVNFSQFVASGVMSQAATEAAKDSNTSLSKNFELAHKKFVKSLESCIRGDLSMLDMVATRILQLIKDGNLIAAPGINLPNDSLRPVNDWIGGKKKFVLLYSTSKDGLSTSTFHQKCDNKGATVTIITSSDGYVFGGYAAIPWSSSNGHKQDSSGQSFLFSLKNPRNTPPAKFSPTNNGYSGIYDSSSYGPTFGNGHDIIAGYGGNIGANTYTSLGNGYSNPTGVSGDVVFTGSRVYTLKDLEVYQVQ